MSTMTNESQKFLLDYTAGKRPAVPDSVWHGADCWILEIAAEGWRLSADGRRKAVELAAAANKRSAPRQNT